LVNEAEITDSESSDPDSPIMKRLTDEEALGNRSADISTDTSLVYESSPAIN
jgi:hypothetical protein